MEKKSYKYYDLVMAAFVTTLICSNVIGAAKLSHIPPFEFLGLSFPGMPLGAGVLFFPLSYIFGDILTEVYGYARARKVVWAGFAALFFASFMSFFIVYLPPMPGWTGQEHYEAVFGQTPRIVAASLVAFWAGEFANSYVLAKLKVRTAGRLLWMRTIGSTLAGQLVDSLLFYPLAFWGVWSPSQVLTVLFTNYLLKSGWEAVMTPVTYRIVGALKRRESEDYFDTDTDFTPFSLKDR